MATNQEAKTSKIGGRATGPHAKVKAGSSVVPIYQSKSGDRVRYAVSFYRDGKRLPKMFSTLDEAKNESLFVAPRIQVGMQQVTDLKPHERNSIEAGGADHCQSRGAACPIETQGQGCQMESKIRNIRQIRDAEIHVIPGICPFFRV